MEDFSRYYEYECPKCFHLNVFTEGMEHILVITPIKCEGCGEYFFAFSAKSITRKEVCP